MCTRHTHAVSPPTVGCSSIRSKEYEGAKHILVQNHVYLEDKVTVYFEGRIGMEI